MNLQNSVQEMKNNFQSVTNIPEWFTLFLKTLSSRNITVDSWNTLVKDVEHLASDTYSLRDFILRMSENMEDGDLSKLISSVTENPLDFNFKNIALNYINGNVDTFKVPSDAFVQKVLNFLETFNLESSSNIFMSESEIKNLFK